MSMDFNIEIRKKQLDHLDQLISSSKKRLHSVLGCLGWKRENFEKEEKPAATCPLNPSHKVTSNKWNDHVEKCIIKAEGYDLKEQFLPEASSDATQSIYIDRNKKIEILTKELTEKRQILRLAWNGLDPDPRTSDRLVSTFSPDERLAFYNYSIQNTIGPSAPPEFVTLLDKKEKNKELSYSEVLTLERDAKRRRVKHKSVHINRKNHTEVIREVIDGQMEEYKEWLLAKEPKSRQLDDQNSNNSSSNFELKEKGEEIDRPHSSISRNSTHSSGSRSTSRRRDHVRSRRSRDRERSHRSRDRRSSERSNRRSSPYSHDGKRSRYNRSSERRRSRERSRRDEDPVRRH